MISRFVRQKRLKSNHYWINHKSFSEAAQALAELDSYANRLVASDSVFGIRIVMVQYVDDNALPTSSYTQYSLIWQGNKTYSDLHGPSFN